MVGRKGKGVAGEMGVTKIDFHVVEQPGKTKTFRRENTKTRRGKGKLPTENGEGRETLGRRESGILYCARESNGSNFRGVSEAGKKTEESCEKKNQKGGRLSAGTSLNGRKRAHEEYSEHLRNY